MDAVEAPAAMDSAPASTERRWAPRLGRMLVFTALMMLSPNAVQLFIRPYGEGSVVAPMAAMLLLMVLFGVLAHRDYTVARRAIQADPSLRGGWFVENAWWVVYLVLIIPVSIGFALALWLLRA